MEKANKLPYEFHVTVEADSTDVDRFKDTASELGVKAIVLDLGINNHSVLRDVMTSSTMMLEDDSLAVEEVNRIANGLDDAGFAVIRRKIESAPWHHLAPQISTDRMPEGCYFESHMAVLSTSDDIARLRAGIAETSDTLPLHISRNAFKNANDMGHLTIMATLRDYTSPYDKFLSDVEESQDRLAELGFHLSKEPIVEFALFDTNTHQDDAWMKR